jgi:alkyl hydroperoxide reductase subunit AhpF
VQQLNAMCALNPNIQHITTDSQTPEMSVPTVLLNGEFFGSGRMSLEQIVRRLDGIEAPFDMIPSIPYDVLIVGGGDSGLAAAHHAACHGIRAAIVAESFTAPLPFDHEIDVINRQRAGKLQIETEANMPLYTITLESGSVIRSKTIILATGAANQQKSIRHCTEWLRDCAVKCTSSGEIIVNPLGATSVPGIFAAGQCSNSGCDGAAACRSALNFLQQKRP